MGSEENHSKNQQERFDSESILATKSIPSLYFRFALAGIMANLILGIVALIDGHFVSYFSVLEVEGIGIGFTVMVITRMIGILFGIGAGAVISLRLGKGKIEEARSIMGQTLWFTLFVSSTIAVLGLVFEKELMILFGASSESLPYAIEYSRLLWLSLPLTNPTLAELDAISVEHPIMISRTCNHISVINSKGLELAHINEQTPNPPGGMIERSADGALTGRLVETANMMMTQVASYTENEQRQAAKIASDHFVAAGLTSIHDAGGQDSDSFRILQQSVQNKAIRVRVYAMICQINNSQEFVQKMMQAGVVTGTGDAHFKIGPAKMFTDGSSTGPTIATRQPYDSDGENYGILYQSEDEIYEVLGEAHKKGYQITVHAQGDKAIEMYLNCVERALKESPRENHRHRIEHAGVSMPDLQQRMKALNVIPIPNPPFPYEFGEIYAQHYGERVEQMYAARDFIDNGIIAAGSSDAPVTDINPLLGIHVAVNRKSKLGKDIGTSQCVSVIEAIKLYTWNGAYASFEEEIKGSLEVGKLADFVVLNDSILTVQPENIKDMRVETTVIDGAIVYDNTTVARIPN